MIGASVNKPHTSKLNSGISLIYVYIYILYVCHSVQRYFGIVVKINGYCGQKSPKTTADKEDRLQCRREHENPQHAAGKIKQAKEEIGLSVLPLYLCACVDCLVYACMFNTMSLWTEYETCTTGILLYVIRPLLVLAPSMSYIHLVRRGFAI